MFFFFFFVIIVKPFLSSIAKGKSNKDLYFTRKLTVLSCLGVSFGPSLRYNVLKLGFA